MFKDPFIISSIILAFSFLFLLICNHKLKSKVIKFSFLILCLLILILIMIFDNKYIYELLKIIISYFWYPNYLMFTTTIFFNIIVLVYTLFKNNLSLFQKIINYFLFAISFFSYICFNRLEIDTSLYTSLYSNSSLIILRIVSISFSVWLVLTILFNLLNRGKHEK